MDESYWPSLRVSICVVSQSVKAVGSTDGMNRCAATSPNMAIRKTSFVGERIAKAIACFKSRDFSSLASIIMSESDDLHAICHTAIPSIEYLSEQSYYIQQLVHFVNSRYGRNLVSAST